MNQPPRSRPVSRQRPPATRRPATPRPAPRRRVPWVSLTIWGLVIGVGAGIYIQIDRWLKPMFQTPPPPPFLSETPLGRSPTASSDNSGAATDLGSDNSSSDVAASSDGAGNADEAVESGTPASSPESTSETSDAIAVEPSVSNSPALDSNPPVPEPVANSTTRGRVSEPIGLAMRADPSIEAAYLGGLAFNETVTILESSGDGTWQRVRRDFNGLEGWIKAGNIEEITE